LLQRPHRNQRTGQQRLKIEHSLSDVIDAPREAAIHIIRNAAGLAERIG